MVNESLAAAEELEKEGISLEIIDPRTLVPLDVDAIRRSVSKTGRLIVVDEACPTCGAASEIISQVVEDKNTFDKLKSQPVRVCGLNIPIPFSPPMEQYALPDKHKIINAVRGVCS
jgi:acetoin:2,6-dichlorophenolindophenol oxidoreductase subunit beta